MKIGILTFHRSYNYGAFLQCYSLSKRLTEDFPDDEVYVIDYSFDDNIAYHDMENKATGKIKTFLTNRNRSISGAVDCLPLSEERIISKSYKDLYSEISKKYDVIVIGSDAVFNWNGKGLPNAFMPIEIKGPKFVSFAASSHGAAYSKADKSVIDNAKKSFEMFSYLGVRDITTENMIRYCGCEAEVFHNCDPTVFLDLNALPVDMEKLAKKLMNYGIDLNKPIVGIMAGDLIGRGIKKYFKDSIQLVAVYQPNKYADFIIDDLNPFEWARVFSFFSATITHFFHGTMFSFKNNIPTIITEIQSQYSKEHDTKIVDLLKRTGLTEFYFPFNINTSGFYQRVLRRLGISDRKYRKELCKRIEQSISNKLPEGYITERLQKEAVYYDGFLDYMKNLKKELENKH